jgi:hypothetical protein
MARKPAHLTVVGGKPRGRQAVWETIRKLKTFTLRELAEACPVERGTIRTYLICLERGGYIRRSGTKPAPGGYSRIPYAWSPSIVFDFARDVGIEAPRLRKDGTPCTQGNMREQMWRTMKILPSFTPQDLAIAASLEEAAVSVDDAKDYIKHLCRAGYLILVRAATGGKGQPQALYRFNKARNSGPKAPMVQRVKSVFDPNLGKIVWHEEVST